MVDLGLSVKWANMNLGADSPEDYGNYYAWGETEEKEEYTWQTYQYGSTQNLGENFNISGTENDAAHVHMGNAWRMPTNIELKELFDNCSWTWTSQNNVNGYRVTSRKVGYTDKSIFLPAAGFKYDKLLRSIGSWGAYPSSVQLANNSEHISVVCFKDASNLEYRANGSWFFNDFWGEDTYRFVGRTIRPVASIYNAASDGLALDVRTDSCTWRLGDNTAVLHGTVSSMTPFTRVVTAGFIIGKNDSITIDSSIKTYPQQITQASTISQTLPVYDNMGYWYRAYVVTADSVIYGKARHYGREAVDLGLPSGRLWANMNVGATTPEDYGGYYAWGETEEKETYTWGTYQYGSKQNLGIDSNISGSEHDVAHVNMGNAWRMPTYSDIWELWDMCSWTWTSQNNVNGYKVTGPNGNSIFLPAAGLKSDNALSGLSEWGSYPCSEQIGDNYEDHVYTFDFQNSSSRDFRRSGSWYFGDFWGKDTYRFVGRTVRAVFVPTAVISDTLTLNVLTDSATWKLDDTSATVYGTLSSTAPLLDGTQVGFIVGNNAAIEKHNATIYNSILDTNGRFSTSIPIVNNMGYWYRTFVELPNGDVFYGSARHFGWEMVDLGLPSGTLWCNMNVGSSLPEEYGDYYAWGEIVTKDNYSATTYLYGTTIIGNSGNIAGTSYDVVTAKMNSNWCMPTYEQMRELRDNCTWTWATENDVDGYRITGKTEGYTDHSIFLPSAGAVFGNSYASPGGYGSYYTSTLNNSDAHYTYTLDWNTTSNLGIYSSSSWSPFGESNTYAAQRYYGRSVRAVANK